MSTVDSARSDTELLQRLTAIVPVRNGERLLPGCLTALCRNGVIHVVVVDGLSSDRSRAVAAEHGAVVVSDEGRGLPYARTLGARTATTDLVLLVDADVVFPDGAVAALVREFQEGEYTALQAGQESVGGPGYWGRALANHHRSGRSRHWFGLVATVFEREELLGIGFDDLFQSGEDIDLRWRLRASGRRAAVSRDVVVQHRFARDDFAFAKDQFLMDGVGLGLMVRRNGARGLWLALLPAAAAARGMLLSFLRGQAGWIPYYGAFAWWNYVGMARGARR
jgi:glycosyltransferase involved in cell wall biosynthesis